LLCKVYLNSAWKLVNRSRNLPENLFFTTKLKLPGNMSKVVLGFGNPLLDIVVHVGGEYLAQYDLKPANSILAESKHLPIYEEISKHADVEYIAGGAAQNTMRACQWLSGNSVSAHYIGCIGKDENGKILKSTAEKDGLKIHYLINDNTPTGTCAVLITDKDRSLVANLGAANHYKKEHIEKEEIQHLINEASVFYVSGYFITVSSETLEATISVGQHAAKHNKRFVWNISAPFIPEFFNNQVMAIIPYADVVFGNETEGMAFGKKQGWGEDLKEIAKKIAELPKENKNRPRLVVLTQGSHPAIVYCDGKLTEYPGKLISKELIVDLNGAGDCFVGGFLSRYTLDKSIEECMSAAHYSASEVIQVSGIKFPKAPNFTFV